jgi:streptogramin lyase
MPNRLLMLALLSLAGFGVLSDTGATANRQCGPRASIALGGRQTQLVVGRGSLWALSCDRGCTARSRPSSGRLVRIDPDSRRVIASTRLRGASDLAVGPAGVYVIDFWSGAVRRLDPRTLKVIARLGLKLPFELIPGDRAFLPSDAAVTAGALWVSTARGLLARIEPDLSRVVATVRLPFDATGDIAAEDGAVWSAEQLAGVYRVDPAADRVVARIRVGPRGRRLAIQSVVLGGGEVFAVGARTGRNQVTTGETALVRIDPVSNRVEAVMSLPGGAGSAVAYGAGALWVAQLNGPSIYRLDPETGRVTDEVRAKPGAAFAIAGGRLWTICTARLREPALRPCPPARPRVFG